MVRDYPKYRQTSWLFVGSMLLPTDAQSAASIGDIQEDDWREIENSVEAESLSAVSTTTSTDRRIQETLEGDLEGSLDVRVWLKQRMCAFVSQIERDLEDDVKEAVAEGGTVAAAKTTERCVALARTISRVVAPAPHLKAAAFCDEQGRSSLVLQSLVAKRRLTYEVSEQDDRVSATQVDQHMAVTCCEISALDDKQLQELAAWVNRQA